MPDHDSLAKLVDQLRSEQRCRWLAGDRALVEAYVQTHPELVQHEDELLDFVYSEYCLRGELRDPMEPEQYYERFPQLAERLKSLLEVRESTAGSQTDVRLLRAEQARRFPLRLNCPHCHSPIEVVADTPDDEVLCPSCGSSFRLDSDRTQTWSKDKLPTLGKFELIEAAGRGAFGTVYRARDTQLQRMVAVKVPRSGRLATDEDEARFVKEARNAAQLQHAGIVPVYEVGRSETFPYIVSEFVEGITLADALTARRFGFREAAELVRQVAEALEHAHDRGVVHRDLKPSNILLTPEGRPRVMDFGLAKRDAGEITVTMEGQLLGTPAYMSPEQASGKAHHVDGRSDVYSLGVILYELLTGELPFRGNQRMLLHQVLHDEPRQARSLNDRIPRDLQTITSRAMAKEPARRYQTAQAMADDLVRWLRGEPIVARPISRLERGWRWCRRNPTVTCLSVAALLALVSGSAFSTYFALRAIAERDRAEEGFREARLASDRAESEARTASSVSEFLIGMFEQPTPYRIFTMRLGNRELSAASRVLLDRGAQQLGNRLDGQPLLKARLMAAIGRAHFGTGDLRQAADITEQVLRICRSELPPDNPQIAQILLELGTVYYMQSRIAEAEEMLRDSLDIYRRNFSESDEAVISAKLQLALLLGVATHHRDEAERLLRDVVAARRQALKPDDIRLGEALLGLAGVLLWQDGRSTTAVIQRRAEAGLAVSEAVRILQADETTRETALAISEYQQAMLFGTIGKGDRAVALLRKALQRSKDALGDDHPMTAFIMSDLALELFQLGRRPESRASYDELFAIYQSRGILALFPNKEPLEVQNYETLLMEAGETAKLELILRRVWDKQKELTNYRSRAGIAVLSRLVILLTEQKRTAAAEALVDDYLGHTSALDRSSETLDISQLLSLAEGLRKLGRMDAAAAALNKCVAILRRDLSHDLGMATLLTRDVVRVLTRMKMFGQAEELLRELFAIQQSQSDADDASVGITSVLLAEAIANQQRAVEAEPLFVGAVDRLHKAVQRDKRDLSWYLRAANKLGDALIAKRDDSSAEHVLGEGVDTARKIGGTEVNDWYWMLVASLSLGRVHLRQGEPELARQSFEQIVAALSSVPESDERYAILADARSELARMPQDEAAAIEHETESP